MSDALRGNLQRPKGLILGSIFPRIEERDSHVLPTPDLDHSGVNYTDALADF